MDRVLRKGQASARGLTRALRSRSLNTAGVTPKLRRKARAKWVALLYPTSRATSATGMLGCSASSSVAAAILTASRSSLKLLSARVYARCS